MNLHVNAATNSGVLVTITDTAAHTGTLVWLRMQQHAACLWCTCRLGQCLHAIAIKHELGVQDGLYTLSEMECMGSCVNAPMIAVANYSGPDVRSFSYTYYEDLTPEDAVSIMEDLKAGKKPRVSASVSLYAGMQYSLQAAVYLYMAGSNCFDV